MCVKRVVPGLGWGWIGRCCGWLRAPLGGWGRLGLVGGGVGVLVVVCAVRAGSWDGGGTAAWGRARGGVVIVVGCGECFVLAV